MKVSISIIVFLVFLRIIAPARAEVVAHEATGVIMPKRSVTLDAKIVGRIISTHAEEGDIVKKDQVLIQLDDAEWQADLASAEASLSLAIVDWDHKKKAAQRTQDLTKSKSFSQELQDEADFAFASAREMVKQANAAVAKSRAILKEAQIHAPFNAIIIKKNAELGQLTQAGSSLITLEDQSQLKIRAKINEQDVPHIKIGQTIAVTINALANLNSTGEVIRVIPSGDVSTHAFTVDVLLPTHKGLLPGMFGKLSFPGEQ